MQHSIDISELILRAKSDDAAQEALLSLYRSYLRLLARTQVGAKLRTRVDASDLVQETLFQAFVSYEQFRGTTEKELLAWLRKILQSQLLQFLRTHSAAQRDFKLDRAIEVGTETSSLRLKSELAAAIETPSEQAIKREAEVLLSDAIERLPSDYRDVIALHHIEGLKFADVATRMNKTPAAAQRMWIRALQKLRSILKQND